MKLNRTALRTIEILKMISSRPDGMTLDEICEVQSLPKTSAYDIVTTLVHLEMLEQNKGQKISYTIGLGAYRIGVNYINHTDWMSRIEPELKSFAKELGKTVFLGVRSGRDVVYIGKAEPENPIITTATVGTKNPVYCTSLGKAIMAYMEEVERGELIGRIRFQAKTERTITDREGLLAELDKVQKAGYAVDDREIEEHMKCVGAPIFSHDGSVLGAISASSLYQPSEDYEGLGERIAKKAGQLSEMLGFSVDKTEGNR